MKKEVTALFNTAPKTLKVGAYNYDVILDPEWIIGSDEKNKWGTCDTVKFTLSVGNLKEMPSAPFLVGILLHEIFHAIWAHQNLRPKESEENVMVAFEVGMVQVLRDNPNLLDWIKKGLK